MRTLYKFYFSYEIGVTHQNITDRQSIIAHVTSDQTLPPIQQRGMGHTHRKEKGRELSTNHSEPLLLPTWRCRKPHLSHCNPSTHPAGGGGGGREKGGGSSNISILKRNHNQQLKEKYL